jgi:hypothetical protein
MSCINKADKAYKALQSVYGDALAEAFVRAHPFNKGKSEDMTFDIPSKKEVKDWLTQQKLNIPKNVKRAMEINPYLSENAIKSMLKGVISKHKDAYFITTGWIFSGSTTLGQEVFETIYKPNMQVMEKLQDEYPDIFRLKGTKNTYTTVVEITPRVKEETAPEEEDLDEEIVTSEEPEIAESLRTYRSIVDMNNGRKPVEFMAGNFKWQLNKNGLYNLVDKFTNDVYVRNMDLDTGEMIPEIDPGTPASEEKRDRIFRSVMQMIREQKLDEYLAVKGIDTADIYESLRDAETDRDLNKVIETLLKAIC